MLSVDSTNRLNHVCLLMKNVELSIRRISYLPSGVLSANQSHRRRVRAKPPVRREFANRFQLTANQLYCTVVLSGCQPAVRYCWPHTVRGLAVLRASGEQESRRADDVAFVLFTVPLLCVKFVYQSNIRSK